MAGNLRRFFTGGAGAFAVVRADTSLQQQAQTLFDQILPGSGATSVERNTRGGDNEPDKIWALVAVVATAMTRELQHEGDEHPDNHWDLVQLLAEAGVGLQEFLLYLTSLFNRLLLAPELLQATTLLKEEFTVATLLFEKYRVLWEALGPSKKQLREVDPEPESLLEKTSKRRRLFEAGWLLFLLAKRLLSDRYVGLGQLYNLLLAVLHLVINNAQVPQLSVEAEVAAALSAMGALGGADAKPSATRSAKTSAEILEALCATPKVNPDEVSSASQNLMLVLKQLKDCGVLQEETGEKAEQRITVFENAVLAANVTRLAAKYKDDYLDGCGRLDERFFLDMRVRCAIMGTKLAQDQTVVGNAASATPSAANTTPSGNGRGTGSTMLSPVRRNMMARRRENGAAAVVRGAMTPPRHQQQPRGRGINSPLMHSWQWQGSPGGARFLASGASPRMSPSTMFTPVTAAVETSNWVRETLSSNMVSPVTTQLRQFFADCAIDPTERIDRVLREHSELLLASRPTTRVSSARVRSTAAMMVDEDEEGDSTENGNQQNATIPSGVDESLKRTKSLSIVLFYRTLEPLLRSERERLRNTDFSKLLNNEVFLAALFACSAEVVLKAHSLITISYPFLLDHLHVNAFHFVTTSESFVKYAPKLPVALKKHMGDVKNRILDSLVWRSDSALYQLMANGQSSARPTTSAPNTPISSASPSLSNTATRAGNGAAVSGGAAHAPVLRLFFRMVFSRAASRIYQLGNLLGLDSTDLNQIWTAMKECLTSHCYLLRDRHLDLIVLCNVYAVCKVARGPNTSHAGSKMSFKRLLACYKQLNRQAPNAGGGSPFGSQNTEGVTFNIKLDDDTRGDIIKFYNRLYITPMKVFILQFQLQESQMAAADAVVAEASGAPQTALQGFTPRKEGSNGALSLAASTSDAESIAQAASEAVAKLLQVPNVSSNAASNGRSSVLPSTPPRPTRRGIQSSPFGSPAVSALQMFTSAEVQPLPVSMHQTSPKRVRSSNVFMSPLQQVRLDRRSQLTPRSHALYAFGESPARDLALINRAVNAAPMPSRRGPPVLNMNMDSDTEQDGARSATASPSLPTRKKQKTTS